MKTFKFVVEMYVRGEDAQDAAEHLTGELKYLFEADNNCVAFVDPENGQESEE